MPGLNRTGPMGGGPRTGRGLGLCGTAGKSPRFSWSGFFRGIGRGGAPWGGGGGRCFGGRRNWFSFGGSAPTTSAGASDEVEALRAGIAAAKEEIAAMEARLSELDKKE
ncbi:DUF5320 domain-containing protein [Desulfomonile tiedjei]|uniref:DUF5320 domain-containing protein n=1 Tax=Desulfomonile tiedjei (strain ATCC 49306 / DSM 6799 / DCB-1) TaxID=706587 RepID=I4C531_DESTA|nr:DUF5320 domain-containing protein [Desulfomonile tiedjei]AFM24672.1 hypothetical protein Desti_1967 [Desulfomonile tiedjei DSM 6799]